jgi:tetratricopeptide (TPR) repeat protein
VWDDTWYIRDNLLISEVSATKNVFKLLMVAEDAPINVAGSGYFRPLADLTLVLDYTIYGRAPYGYRLTNILLSTLCSIALFYLVMLLTGNRLLSFVTALIFTAQAVHVESVTWISARNGIMCMLFMLLSFYHYIKHVRLKKSSHLVYSLMFLFLAAASKEFGFVMPLIFIFYDYCFNEDFSIKKNLLKYAAAFSAVALFIIYKSQVTLLGKSFTLEPLTLTKRIAATFPIMVKYMINQIVPYDLGIHSNHQLKESFFDPIVIISFLILITLIVIVFRQRKKDKMIFFSFFSYLILLTPVSNIAKIPGNTLMADRWLYPASFSFALFLSHLLCKFLKGKERLISIVVILFVVFLSFFTIQRNYVFKNNFTLFSDAVKKNPTSAMILTNLGHHFQEAGNNDKAINYYNEALTYSPDYYIAYINLSAIYGSKGEYQKALNMLKKADSINPDNPLTLNNIGAVHGALGNYDESNKYYNLAISIKPDLYHAYFLLANNYYVQRKDDKAIETLKKVLKRSPDEADRQKASEQIKRIMSEQIGGKD